MMYKMTPILFVITLLLSGCNTATVKPWERGNLARPEMAFSNSGLIEAIDEHIYFSKEATSGGRSIAGGGCGCN